MNHSAAAPDRAQIDPVLLTILQVLFHSAPGKPCSLARLSKQSAIQMSTLLRHMHTLLGAGLADMTLREEGGGEATLTVGGMALCQTMFAPMDAGAAPEPP